MDVVIRARFLDNKKESGLVAKIIGWALKLGLYDAVKIVRVKHCFLKPTAPFAVRVTQDGRVELWANLAGQGISVGAIKRYIFSESTRQTAIKLRAGRRKDNGKAWIWKAANRWNGRRVHQIQETSRWLRAVIKDTKVKIGWVDKDWRQWIREAYNEAMPNFTTLHSVPPNGLTKPGVVAAYAEAATILGQRR